MKPNDRPKRTSDVKCFLTKNGIRGARLVKGQGYFCFEGKATNSWIDHTIKVPFLSDLTFDQWMRTFKAMNDNPANNAIIRNSGGEISILRASSTPDLNHEP